MGLFSKTHEREVNLLLDVGNGSVGAALIQFTREGKPSLLYTKRLPLSIPERSHREKLPTLVLALLKEVIESTATEGVMMLQKKNINAKKVTHTFCVLSAPWYVSKTKILSIKNQQPLAISQAFIDELMKKEDALFKQEVATRKSGALSIEDIGTIEQKIIQTKLNGYSTPNPFQKKAREIDLALYLAVTSHEFKKSLEKIVGKYFYAKHMVYHSFALVGHNVISDIFIHDSNYIFMDISAEVTDVSAIEDRVLMDTASFPLGRNFIVQKVAEIFNVAPEIALSSINLYRGGLNDAFTSSKIEEAFAAAQEEWGQFFAHCVQDVTKNHIPTKVFVTVDDEVCDFFTKVIKEQFKSVPVVILNNEKLSEYVEFDPTSRKDPFLALESLFFHKLFLQDE